MIKICLDCGASDCGFAEFYDDNDPRLETTNQKDNMNAVATATTLSPQLMAFIEADYKAPMVRGLIRRDLKLALSSAEVEAMTKEELIAKVSGFKPPVAEVIGLDWSAPDLPWLKYEVSYNEDETINRRRYVEATSPTKLDDLERDDDDIRDEIRDDAGSFNLEITDQGDWNEESCDSDNNGLSNVSIEVTSPLSELALAVAKASDASILKHLCRESAGGQNKSQVNVGTWLNAVPGRLAQMQAKVEHYRQMAIDYCNSYKISLETGTEEDRIDDIDEDADGTEGRIDSDEN